MTLDTRRMAGLLAAVSVLAAVAWITLGRESVATVPASPGAARPRTPAEVRPRIAAGDFAGPDSTRGARHAGRVEASGVPTPPSESVEPAPAPAPETYHPLVLTCVRGDRRALDTLSVEFTLTRVADRKQVQFYTTNSNTAVAEIPLGIWELRVLAPGFRQVMATHDFSDLRDLESSRFASSPAFVEQVYLWPDDWIPVIARTREGQTLTELALEHGIDPEAFMVNAFSVRASYFEKHLGFGTPGMEQGPLCRFHPRQGWERVELPGAVIGSLEILQPRPFWLRVNFFGVPYTNRKLFATDREVVVEIGDHEFSYLRGDIKLRVVERHSGAPIVGAVATLEPTLASNGGDEPGRHESDAKGRIVIEKVLPGSYDLVITHRDRRAVHRLQIKFNSPVYLGEIRLGTGPGILVRVVDLDGEPVQALIDVVPFVDGEYAGDLSGVDLSRTTAEDGTYYLELPEGPAIVRARPTSIGSPDEEFHPLGTRSIRVDPDDPPAEIVLVAEPLVEVTVDFSQASAAWEDGQHLDFIYNRASRAYFVMYRLVDPTTPLLMVPGDYDLQRWYGGQLIRSHSENARIGREPRTIRMR